MKKLIFLIALSFSSASFSQSLSEKLIPKIPKTPGLICIKDQCARIGYFSHPPLSIAVVSLHGEDFIGWRPPCPYCDDLLQDHAAAEALEEQVKRRFPDAKTGDKFQSLYR